MNDMLDERYGEDLDVFTSKRNRRKKAAGAIQRLHRGAAVRKDQAAQHGAAERLQALHRGNQVRDVHQPESLRAKQAAGGLQCQRGDWKTVREEQLALKVRGALAPTPPNGASERSSP